MNEQLVETLSAIVDGQADDLEVRRLLKALDNASDEEAQLILAQWERFQTIGSTMRGEQANFTASAGFAAAVSAAIDAEPPIAYTDSHSGMDLNIDSQSNPAANSAASSSIDSAAVAQASGGETTHSNSQPFWRQFAVAATVAFAVIIGVQEYGSFSGAADSGVSAIASVEDNQAPAQAASVQATNSSGQLLLAAADAKPAISQDAVLSEADRLEAAAAQRRLNEYILQHTSHAAQQSGQGIIPFARLANFEEE